MRPAGPVSAAPSASEALLAMASLHPPPPVPAASHPHPEPGHHPPKRRQVDLPLLGVAFVVDAPARLVMEFSLLAPTPADKHGDGRHDRGQDGDRPGG